MIPTSVGTHDPLPQTWLDQMAQGELPAMDRPWSSTRLKVLWHLIDQGFTPLLDQMLRQEAVLRSPSEQPPVLDAALVRAARHANASTWDQVWSWVDTAAVEEFLPGRAKAAEAAVLGGHPERMIQVLARMPANPHHPPEALHAAVAKQDLRALTWLLERAAQLPNLQQEATVALLTALAQRSAEAIALLARHVDPTRTPAGHPKSPLDVARQQGEVVVAQVLEGGFTQWQTLLSAPILEEQLGHRLDALMLEASPDQQADFLKRLEARPTLLARMERTRSDQRLRALQAVAAIPSRGTRRRT